MSFNKKDGELDFSNVKMTQLGSSQSIRASFSELNSALRTVDTNTIVKDAYTHFIQEVDAEGNPTKVTYYQATSPVIDELFFVSDVGSNLASKYIVLQEFLTKKEIVFYIKVGGVGVNPGIGDEQVAVDIEENDPASVVRLNFMNAMKQYEDFQLERVGGYTGTSIQVTYLQFGETQAIDVTDTGFFVIRRQEGSSFEVGEACIEYDVDGNPIWNGNLLKGMTYNAFAGTFQTLGGGGSGDCGPIDFVDDLKENNRLKIDVIGSLNFASTAACAYLNQITQQTSIDEIGEVLEIDNAPMNSNPVVIDLSTSGEYLITASGNFEFDLKVTADTDDGSRRTSRTVLEKFNTTSLVWEEIDSSVGSAVAYGYHRNNASGENTASSKVILAVSTNDKFRYTIKCINNGLIKTVPDGISLSIKQV